MPQTWNMRAFDYQGPPILISNIVRGRTWAKFCEPCGREVAIDVLAVLEHHEIYDRVDDDRFRCRECGGRLKGNNGYVIRALRFIGRWPVEKTIVWPESESVPAF